MKVLRYEGLFTGCINHNAPPRTPLSFWPAMVSGMSSMINRPLPFIRGKLENAPCQVLLVPCADSMF